MLFLKFIKDVGMNTSFASEGSDEIDFFRDLEFGGVEFFEDFLEYFFIFKEDLFGLFELIGLLFI